MSKREAAEAAFDVPPAKRLYRGGPDDLYIDDAEDDLTSAHTPYSTQDPDSPQTVNTAATTPRAKFPSDLKTLACTWPGCPKTFNRPARLRDHLNSHTNSRPFKCPYDGCDKDYIEDKHLKQHIKAVHTLERKHVCQKEGCGKSFVTGTRLKRHQAVHEGEERFRCQDYHQGLPALQCPEQGCPMAQNSGSDSPLKCCFRHISAKSIKICIFCEFKSASRWELEKHVEMHHSGQSVEDRKNIACPYDECTKKFTKKSNLNAHIRTAHEGFRFVCGQVDLNSSGLQGWTNDQGCGDKFSTKSRLEDHIRYKHLGHERPKLSKPEPSQEMNLISERLLVPTAMKPSFATTTGCTFLLRWKFLQHNKTGPTNILLLARDSTVQDPLIDPALGTL
ncbi:hypothetical protein QL093DRAFT_2247165 [Fusarium oxysporum]|nr:hypothetical protein QL093DRAFT_2247165 [Fusarium oxysporum]